jgi:hypothetical protein
MGRIIGHIIGPTATVLTDTGRLVAIDPACDRRNNTIASPATILPPFRKSLRAWMGGLGLER